MRVRERVLLILTLAGSVAGVSAQAATAARFGGFSARPAQFNPNDPATRAYFKPTVAPGQQFTGDVIVTNEGDGPVKLFVYPVDGLTGVTSGSVYGDRSDPLHRAGRWLTPAARQVDLAAHASQTVAFTVRVPAGALPGDHLAGVALENAHPKRTGHGHFSVTEILRVVVGVEIRVPGPAAQAIALTGASLRALPGTPVGSVVIDLANRGRLVCQPRLAVRLRVGGRWQRAVRDLHTVLPGDAIPYPFAWMSPIPAGRYQVTVRATHCGAPVTMARTVSTGVGLSADGERGGPAGVSLQPATATPVWMLSLIGVGGLLAGILVALVIYATRRRRSTS